MDAGAIGLLGHIEKQFNRAMCRSRFLHRPHRLQDGRHAGQIICSQHSGAIGGDGAVWVEGGVLAHGRINRIRSILPGAEHKCTERRDIPGSLAFVPSVAGLIIAGEVVQDIAFDRV